MKPAWIAARAPRTNDLVQIRSTHLATVCEEARCPNLGECWAAKTATFLLMGRVCTRACRFCHVQSGRHGEPLDDDEPRRVASAIRKLGLAHCVLTSVDRDDLLHGGANHLARCVRAAKDAAASVEILIPDFLASLDIILGANPDVLAHNVETVERLSPTVRDRRASYERSIVLLARAKERSPDIVTKTSVMLGLGETDDEVTETIGDIAEAGVDILTLGQYLRPSPRHAGVERYVEPATFEELAVIARARGIRAVASGSLVRSSYRAAALLEEARMARRLLSQGA